MNIIQAIQTMSSN